MQFTVSDNFSITASNLPFGIVGKAAQVRPGSFVQLWHRSSRRRTPHPFLPLYPRPVQHSRSLSSFTGGQTWLRCSHRNTPATKMVVNPPQKHRSLSSKELYGNPWQTQSPPLPVAGSWACRVARMAILLHLFILPGQTVLGTGEKKRRGRRRRRGSSTGCAGVWPPQEEAQLFWGLSESTCRLPLPSQPLTKGWGLPSWYWCLGFPLLFILFLSAIWFLLWVGVFFHFVLWFLDHPHSAAAGLCFWYGIWPDFKRRLCNYSQCAAQGINRNLKL